jgi:hypothetical protein
MIVVRGVKANEMEKLAQEIYSSDRDIELLNVRLSNKETGDLTFRLSSHKVSQVPDDAKRNIEAAFGTQSYSQFAKFSPKYRLNPLYQDRDFAISKVDRYGPNHFEAFIYPTDGLGRIYQDLSTGAPVILRVNIWKEGSTWNETIEDMNSPHPASGSEHLAIQSHNPKQINKEEIYSNHRTMIREFVKNPEHFAEDSSYGTVY